MRGMPPSSAVHAMRGRWCFSRTGASTASDFLSKHVVHNKGHSELLYAGEMHVEHEPVPGGYRCPLIVDNNSGTYAPDPKHLPDFAALLQRAFPGLLCEGWDQADARLHEAIAKSPTRRPNDFPHCHENEPRASVSESKRGSEEVGVEAKLERSGML